MAEVFRAVTDAMFADLPGGRRKPAGGAKSSVVTRNLQRAYLNDLTRIVLKGGAVPDARSLAKMHLRDISKRIDLALGDKKGVADDTLRAHLEDVKESIGKALSATATTTLP